MQFADVLVDYFNDIAAGAGHGRKGHCSGMR
jgi:hypothetical protein